MKKNLVINIIIFLFILASNLSSQDNSTIKASGIQEYRLRQDIIEFAQKYLGVPYVWGGQSPKGFDCTGIVWYAYHEITGFSLPRATRQLSQYGLKVSKEDSKPGDIFIFDTTGGPSHAAIYLGDNKILHAASAGPKTGIIISDMDEKYYKTRYLYTRRAIINEKSPDTPVSEENRVFMAKSPFEELTEPLSTFNVDLKTFKFVIDGSFPIAMNSKIEFMAIKDLILAGDYIIEFGIGTKKDNSFKLLQKENIKISAGQDWFSPSFKLSTKGKYSFIITNLKTKNNLIQVLNVE